MKQKERENRIQKLKADLFDICCIAGVLLVIFIVISSGFGIGLFAAHITADDQAISRYEGGK